MISASSVWESVSICPRQRAKALMRSRSEARVRAAISSVSTISAAAAVRGTPPARARSWSSFTVVSPMPRRGVLMMRSKARSSAPCATTRK